MSNIDWRQALRTPYGNSDRVTHANRVGWPPYGLQASEWRTFRPTGPVCRLDRQVASWSHSGPFLAALSLLHARRITSRSVAPEPAAYWVYENHNMDSNIIEYVRTLQDVCKSVSSKDHQNQGGP